MIQLGELFVNRSDGFGIYKDNGASYTAKQAVTDALLSRHIAGEVTIGLHTTNPETQTCLWSCLDYDDHDGAKDPAVYRAAMATYGELRDRGLNPVLEDSNGAGGYHIWLFFESAAPTAAVHGLVKGIADRHQIPGTETRNPEGFPKQSRVREDGWGNFVRLPGRHHKRRDHWSLIYDGGAWHSLSVPDNWARLIDVPKCPLSALPEAAEGALALTGAVVPDYVISGGEGVPQALKDMRDEDRRRAPGLVFSLTDNYRDEYEKWWRVGRAVWDTFQADDQGLSVFRSWSMGSPKYQEGDCEKHWRSFHDLPEGKGITFGSLVYWAKGAEDASSDALERLDAIHDPMKPEQGATPELSEEGRAEALEYIRRASRLPILQWIQRGDEAGHETFYVRMEGVADEIRIGDVAAVLGKSGYAKFKGCIYTQGRLQMAVSAEKWTKITAHLVKVVDIQRVDDETVEGRIRNALETYFDAQPIGPELDEAITRAGKPFKQDGCLYVQVRRVVAATGGRFHEPYKTFSRAGWKQKTVNTSGTTRSFWFAPLDSGSIPAIVRNPAR